MATRVLSFPYVLLQNKNDESTAYGKYFAKTWNTKASLNLKGLAQRVAMDQSCFTPEIAAGVIDKLTTDMVELLQSGTSVKWDGLGTFRPTVESKGKAVPTDYDVNTDVKGIHIRFIPTNDKGEELTSRKYAELCTFVEYGKKQTQKVETATGKIRYTGYTEPQKSLNNVNKYPFLLSVDGVDIRQTDTVRIKTTGSSLRFNGGVNGTYELKRGATAAAGDTLGSDTFIIGSGNNTIEVASGQTADASNKKLWLVSPTGEKILVAKNSTIVAGA